MINADREAEKVYDEINSSVQALEKALDNCYTFSDYLYITVKLHYSNKKLSQRICNLWSTLNLRQKNVLITVYHQKIIDFINLLHNREGAWSKTNIRGHASYYKGQDLLCLELIARFMEPNDLLRLLFSANKLVSFPFTIEHLPLLLEAKSVHSLPAAASLMGCVLELPSMVEQVPNDTFDLIRTNFTETKVLNASLKLATDIVHTDNICLLPITEALYFSQVDVLLFLQHIVCQKQYHEVSALIMKLKKIRDFLMPTAHQSSASYVLKTTLNLDRLLPFPNVLKFCRVNADANLPECTTYTEISEMIRTGKSFIALPFHFFPPSDIRQTKSIIVLSLPVGPMFYFGNPNEEQLCLSTKKPIECIMQSEELEPYTLAVRLLDDYISSFSEFERNQDILFPFVKFVNKTHLTMEQAFVVATRIKSISPTFIKEAGLDKAMTQFATYFLVSFAVMAAAGNPQAYNLSLEMASIEGIVEIIKRIGKE